MNPVKVGILKSEYDFIARMARLSEIGGRSAIRGIDRAATLGEDQRVGHIAEAALHKYWFGHLTYYAIGRWHRNQRPDVGDNGSDIFATNIDVKGSLIRSSDRPIMEYRLAVRPIELHKDWVYVLALVVMIEGNPELAAGVYLVGWACSDMFGPVEESGIFKGAHVLKADALHPMMPLKHEWR